MYKIHKNISQYFKENTYIKENILIYGAGGRVQEGLEKFDKPWRKGAKNFRRFQKERRNIFVRLWV